MNELAPGTVTVVFAGVVNPRRTPPPPADRFRDPPREYGRLLRAAFERGGGEEIEVEGDAVVWAFRAAKGALIAAVAVQRAMITRLKRRRGPLRVRIGLHTVDLPPADGPLSRLDPTSAARICSAAHGGQILLSERTRALVEEDLPPGMSLRDLGAHRLKDLQCAEHLFQVVHADLPSNFPSPQSLETLPNNLPVQLTSFVGRERDIADIRQLLTRTRLLTLTGAGGCGKTRLALQVAAELVEDYPDGVWLVELASLSDGPLVPQTIATILGVPEQSDRPLAETLAGYLRSKSLLLVLDNCEHLLSAFAPLADALLRSCPTLGILATSQEPLGIAGELIRPVPPLSLPDHVRPPTLEELLAYESVRLFVERAAFGQPGFALTRSNASTIVQLCHRLDGMPLAIELAAARVKALTVEQIAERLRDRFRLLTGGGRTALPRHQTLRAVMDWSYDLLSNQERALMRRLSVFAGGWSLEAAEAICAGNGLEASGILELLTHLIDRSLVVVDTHGHEARYRLLETVRQYGRDRLLEIGEAGEVRERHRDWYLGLAERADPELRGPEQGVWLKRLEAEHDNLRAALEWSNSDSSGPAMALRLAGALYWFWFIHGHWNEGRGWLEEVLSRAGDVRERALTRVLLGAAHLARQQGDYERATLLSERGLALSRDVEDPERTPWFLINLGLVAWYQNDPAKATALFERSLALSRDLGDKWLMSMSLAQLGGLVATAKPDHLRAAALLTESLTLSTEVGDKYRIAFALRGLGTVALRRGDLEEAAAYYRNSLALSREVNEGWVIQECLVGIAGVACALGYCGRAARLFGAAEALGETLGLHRLAADEMDRERRVAAARAALGDEAFQAAWAEGRTMPLEQAIEIAMAQTEPVASKVTREERTPRQPEQALTAREREVAAQIAHGQTNREIGALLMIAEKTAEAHVQHILDKLGFHSRSQIAAWAVEHGLHTVSRD
jgi:predicted ATPase/DNA-binding CsgD family transcriptional regulator/class 3 adenylate cyclase